MKLPKLPTWAWAAGGLFIFHKMKKPKALPVPKAIRADGTEDAVKVLREEMARAVVSPAWATSSQLQIRTADTALSGSPQGSLSEVIVSELVPRTLGNAAAYAILKGLPESQRQAFAKEMAKPYGLLQLQKAVAFGAWTYLHFGGLDPSVILQGQKYLGVTQTGVLDMPTIEKIKALTGRNIWSQVMLQVKK
jgi:hypothetical protein